MPAARETTNRSNTILGDSDADGLQDALEALTGSTSVLQAIDRVNLLEGMTAHLAAEARAVLDQLPKSIDQAILAALRSGVERGVTTTVAWELGEWAVRVTESGEGADHRVHVVLFTPDGRILHTP